MKTINLPENENPYGKGFDGYYKGENRDSDPTTRNSDIVHDYGRNSQASSKGTC